jgi:Protein of unknown function (DUF2442)
MRPQPASKKDRPAAVNPAPAPRAPWRLTRVEVLGAYRLKVWFQDGIEGEVDLSRLVHAPEAGVFASLVDPAAFSAVYIELGALAWPNGLDFAPDAMHHAIKTHGLWIP